MIQMTVQKKQSINGKGARFNLPKDAVEFGGYVWNDLSYKIKRVGVSDYLLTKYIALSDLDIPETQTVDVITVYSSTNYIGEFMEIGRYKHDCFCAKSKFIITKSS